MHQENTDISMELRAADEIVPDRRGTTEIKWHYTTGDCFAGIVTDGVIRPAATGITSRERPVVWFSTNTEFEPTAIKAQVTADGRLRQLTIDELEQLGRGLVRIGVAAETAPLSWRDVQKRSGMARKMAKNLELVAIAQGARPQNWWGTFDPVVRAQWISIQVCENGKWVEVLHVTGVAAAEATSI